jgi:RNA polymerase sigma-70 factor, ECF subfamily
MIFVLKRSRANGLQFHEFDESYLERLCSGDFRTEQHFVGYFSELIRLKLRGRLRSPQAIEDLRQETFARVFTTLRSENGIREPARLGAFVNSVCNNVLLEHYRSSSREAPIEDDDDSRFADLSLDVVGVISRKQTQEKVHQILAQLSERDRRLVKEIFLDERDKDEVCRDFGVDREYLRVLLHRAKLSFKSIYLKSMAASLGQDRA